MTILHWLKSHKNANVNSSKKLDIKYNYTNGTMNKIDDKAWIREDTLTMLLAKARLKHLQKTHME